MPWLGSGPLSKHHIPRFGIALLLANMAASGSASAGHDVFHIFAPVMEAGHQGFEVLSTFQTSPASHAAGLEGGDDLDHEHGAPRAAHEVAYHVSLSEYWMTKVALSLARDPGDDYRATALASENVFRLRRSSAGPLDFAWYTSLSAGLDSGQTNAIEFGPIVSVAAGPITLVVNPFFEKTFGRNREDGIAFTYAWRLAHSFSEQFAVGIEGHGEIPDIAHAPPGAEQVHRVGPVIYLGHLHGSAHGIGSASAAHHAHDEGVDKATSHGSHAHGNIGEAGHRDPLLHAELGVLFGLTDATPDVALKLNVGLDF